MNARRDSCGGRLWLVLPVVYMIPGLLQADSAEIKVGSKSFAESVVLGELVTGLARSTGATAVHRQGIGGSRMLFNALLVGEIDVYPEYTGTISQEILVDENLRGTEAIRDLLLTRGIAMSDPLGFNNTYAIGMREDEAERLDIKRISDLRRHPDLRFGFSSEFMERGDGWPSLRNRYQLSPRSVRGLEHDFAYRALNSGALDVTDFYVTDAEIRYYDLRALKDDLNHFPRYDAVLLYRAELTTSAPEALAAILKLQGQLSEIAMIRLNSLVKLEKVPEARVAYDFLRERFGIESRFREETVAGRILQHTGEHLYLVAVSLTAAILLSVPLGVVAARHARCGQVILGTVGIIQTVPSIALLVFMIPLFKKIGTVPAIAALFLYSLLPIVRNTYTGLSEIPLNIRESAAALGLSSWARLRLVELPMAFRSILAGIKISAVINVGTATLGGFIAAGGYGQLIFTGLRRDDIAVTLQGAVPAAVLALLVQGLFELAERALVPRGLRLKPETS